MAENFENSALFQTEAPQPFQPAGAPPRYSQIGGPPMCVQASGGPMYSYADFRGQSGYCPGMGPSPPGRNIQVQGSPAAVVTRQVQVVVIVTPVQPVNKSLIVSSLGMSTRQLDVIATHT